MTSDRPAGQPLVAPSSTNNLNPTAPVFCQGGQDKGSQNSFSADVSEKDFTKDFKDGLNLDGAGGEPSDGQGVSSVRSGGENGETEGISRTATGNEKDVSEQDLQYPEEVIAPIRKQLEYYFSQENLPHDKYLNTHMDAKKFVPLRLFPDFNRMKPICKHIDQLVQAVQTSSLLELNEDRMKVRISQTRKTLTLRGLSPNAIKEDIHKLLKDNDCPPAQHIETIVVHTVSNWYVSFPTEDQCMEAFFKLHNSKITVDGYPIGCCIKSSGTHVATGYFPSPEEQQKRRMPQNQVNVPATVQGSISQQPAMQQPPALMQQYNPVHHLHPSLMAPAGQGLYFSQNAQYLPYMPGMIAQSWPGTTGLDPGLMLQSSGLQPQHIRTSLPRPMVQGATPHRFPRPPRINHHRQNIDRNNVPQVSVSGTARHSPRGMDGSVSTNMVQHGPSHISRRSNPRDEITVSQQHAATHHQFVTPIVTHHQVTGVPSTTTIVNPSVMDGVSNTVSLSHASVNVASHTIPQQAQQAQQQAHGHPQSVLIQQANMGGNNPSVSNPILPQSHQPHHIHHHHQPPPQLPHQHPQQSHQQQQPQHNPHNPHQHQQHPHSHHSHHHNMGNSHHNQQHIGTHQQPPPPPPQSTTHQHQQSSMAAAHHHPQPGHQHHQHQHHQHQPQHHHQHHHPHQPHPMMHSQHHQGPPNERRPLVMPPQQLPPQAHHQQTGGPLGNRRNRRRREETTNRNQRERNPNNRANFSSQAPVAADNFTMEANSFPPLPGANNAPSSVTAPENGMMHSDIVKGITRVPSIGSGAPLPVRGNSSSTPSPVATPTLTPSHVPSGGPAIVGIQGDDIDSMVDDDTTSSSQEEAEVDVASVEPVSGSNTRQGAKCDVTVPAAEAVSVPAQPRYVKGSTPAVPSNTGSSNMRQGHNQAPTKIQQNIPLQQQAPVQQSHVPLMAPGNSMPSAEMPKLSYAQILLAQKNREAAAAESNATVVTTTAVPNSSPVSSGIQASTNGPSNNPAGGPNAGRVGQNSNNAFREQGNYHPNSGHRAASHRSPKDGQPRPDGPQTRSMPNGRRNSKENRTGNTGKFDRKKPDGRQK